MRPDMQKIWEEVKANHKALNECPGPHDFVSMGAAGEFVKPNSKFRCTKCNGTVDHHAYHWYTLGMKHGKL